MMRTFDLSRPVEPNASASHIPISTSCSSNVKPAFLNIRCHEVFIKFTVAVAVFTDIFIYSIVVPVFPFSLQTRVAIDPNDVQFWVSVLLACYGIALFAASPLAGWMSDHLSSRRLPFIVGLATETGATVLLMLGNNLVLVAIGRILQGLSAAIVWTVGLALMVDTVGKEKIGSAMGWVSSAMSLGILVGPLLGGVVLEQSGYYSVFAICFGLLGVDMLLRSAMVERKKAKIWIPILDSQRPSTIDLCFVPATSGLSGDASKAELTSSLHKQASVIGDTSNSNSTSSRTESGQTQELHAVIFNQSESPTVPSPRKLSKHMPPFITLLASRRLLAALWACAVQAMIITAFDSTLPIRVRDIFGWDSLGGGLIFIPLILPNFASVPIGSYADRYGPRWLCTIGFLFGSPCIVLLRFVNHNSMTQKIILCILLVLVGLSLALAFAPLLAEVTYCVESQERRCPPGTFGKHGAYAQAYGLYNIAFASGCLVGPIWGGLVKDKSGYDTMVWTIGLLSGVTAIPTLLLVGGWIGGNEKWADRSATPPTEETDTEVEGEPDEEKCDSRNVQPEWERPGVIVEILDSLTRPEPIFSGQAVTDDNQHP